MSLWSLPKEIIAEISRWLPYEPGSNIVRKYARSVVIKDIRNGMTFANGLLHNYNDAPLITGTDQLYCYYGVPHRENGPALINSDGMFWFRYGILHNEDGPAVIIGRTRLWYKNGRLHSYNDNPAIIHADGSHEYYADGLLHRDNAPAITANGISYYYTAGVFIRKENPYNWKSFYMTGIRKCCYKEQINRILQSGKFVI